MKVTLPDESVREYDSTTPFSVAMEIGERLAQAVLAANVNGVVVDSNTVLTSDSTLRLLTFKDDEGKSVFWHSSAHILAIAVKRLFPKVKLTIGPSIENGFYYDFLSEPFTQSDIEKIETEMIKIAKEDLPFIKKSISYEDAKNLFKDNKFKLELVEENKENLSIYQTGNFVDLCKGPHIPSTGKVKAIKLLKMSASYWRGDEKRESLQRIYGISFTNKKELKKYLEQLEEAEKRDHKKIGKKLSLFAFSEKVGKGLPLFLPKGNLIKSRLQDYITEIKKRNGFKFVCSPHIAKKELYLTSGHLGKYDAMMPTMKDSNGEEFVMKAMNCPHHFEMFNSEKHSYKELPLRYGENATVYRNEKSGEINGLLRVKSLTQDDSHIFLREDQIKSEIKMLISMLEEVFSKFGFTDYKVEISTRGDDKENYFGSDDLWNKAESILVDSVKDWGVEYSIEQGEAAFYGPKIDVQVKDAIGRSWQLTTIQLDFNQPVNFNMNYVGEDGKDHKVVVIHSAILGSIERFLGVLIEHYAGRFPLWLNPNQVAIIPVSDSFNDYARSVKKSLNETGIDCFIDDRSEGVSKKVRDAEMQYYNYVLVVGEKEVSEKMVAVRKDGKLTTLSVEKFKEQLTTELIF